MRRLWKGSDRKGRREFKFFVGLSVIYVVVGLFLGVWWVGCIWSLVNMAIGFLALHSGVLRRDIARMESEVAALLALNSRLNGPRRGDE